ncbi:hypothetical protein [Ideonella margarita]|uniref:O-antigen/teichoic acid export membrane protein n=1 Tax=Ideonella margarita TaxID=2984191 RepID=A0ABU9C422_9BURK
MAELDAHRLKKSLLHFAIGKLASSIAGFAMLFLLVRALPRADYGAYIALISVFEFGQLGTNAGAIPAAYRYLPALLATRRLQALSALMTRLLGLRVLTLLVGALALAVWAQPLSTLLGLPGGESVIRIFAAYLLCEGVARFAEMAFDSLLMQGASQVSSTLRAWLRLLVLLVGGAFLEGEWSLRIWIAVEAAVSLVGVTVALVLIWRQMTKWRMSPPADDGDHWDADLQQRVISYSMPSYVAQCIGLLSSVHAVRLAAVSLVGAAAAAAFGFVSLLAYTLQRYLPSFLLIGVIRPMFVAARERGSTGDDMRTLADMVFKLNVLTLAPVWAAFVVYGPELVAMLTAGKLPDALPFVHLFLAYTLGQVVRAEVSLLAVSYEEGAASLTGTIWSLGGLALGLALYPLIGLSALCAGLVLSDALWCAVMLRRLREHDAFWLPEARGLWRLALAMVAACAAGLQMKWLLPAASTPLVVLAGAAACAIAYLVVAAILKPLTPREREWAGKVLPKRLIVF